MYEGYKPDFCEIKRNSRDKYVDSRGKELIEMCIEKQVRILNGRSLGDINGKYTCLTSNGSSVVDYVLVSHSILNKILYFEVSDFLPTLSDCHCKLSWGLLTNFNVPIQETYKKKFPDKYIWDEKSSELFQEALLSVEIQDKINSFLLCEIKDVNIAAEMLNDIYISAANKSLRRKQSKKKENEKQGKIF